MGFAPEIINPTPINPFSDFLDTNQDGGKWESDQRNPDFLRNAVVLISAGNFTSINTLNQKGITASGLFGILKATQNAGNIWTEKITGEYKIGPDNTSGSYVFDSPNSFISVMNNIHNNINDIIRQYIPEASYTDLGPDGVPTGPGGNFANTNSFNFLKDIMFPGSYTGNSGGVLPTRLYNSGEQPDVTGNGITGAFVVYDQPNQEHVLSRTGIEFYTVLTALAYGATVVVNGNYQPMANWLGNPGQVNSYAWSTRADAFMTLDMSTYIDGQGITLASSESRLIYGGSEASYASGNTFNYCHGLTAQWLNSIYTETIKRNNIVNSTLDDDAPTNTKAAYIIHAGLSGAAFCLSQNTSSNDFSDIHRYPGFDGKPSLYQNVPNTAGLTAYTLIEDPYLNRLLCVIGKKQRVIKSPNFGNPTTGRLVLEIPLIADVAGALQRAKSNNDLYKSAVGFPYSTPLNCDSITPTPASFSNSAKTLQSRRINYYVSSSNGLVLATDLIGATSPYLSIDINDRIGVTSMKRVITEIATIILNRAITAGKVNNPSNRNILENEIQSEIVANSGLNASLNPGTIVVIEYLTAATVSATITFFPIQASFGTTAQNTLLSGYTVTVIAQ
jgi:hypothetical protein